MINNSEQQIMESDKKLWLNFLKMAGPYTASRSVAFATDFVANILLARYSPAFFSASSLISSTKTAMIGTSRAALASVNVFSSNAFGRRDAEEVRDVLKNGLIYAAANGLLIIPVVLFIDPIFEKFFHQRSLVAYAAGEFFFGLSWGLPANFALTAVQQFFVSISKPKYALFTTVSNAVLTIGVGYPLVYMTELGVSGMGHAYSVSSWLTLSFAFLMLKFNPELASFRVFESFFTRGINGKLFKEMLRFGSYNALQVGTELSSTVGLSLILGKLDESSLQSAGIVMQYITLSQVPLFSMAGISSSLIGKALGEGHPLTAYKYGKIGLLSELAYTLSVLALFALIPKQLSSVFISSSNDDQVFNSIAMPFLLAGVGQVFDGFKNMGCGNLAGYKKNKIASAASLAMAITVTTLAALSTFVANLGEDGVFGARVIGLALSSIILIMNWYSVANKELRPNRDTASFPVNSTAFLHDAERRDSDRVSEQMEPLLDTPVTNS